jgi:hypothetical protein
MFADFDLSLLSHDACRMALNPVYAVLNSFDILLRGLGSQKRRVAVGSRNHEFEACLVLAKDKYRGGNKLLLFVAQALLLYFESQGMCSWWRWLATRDRGGIATTKLTPRVVPRITISLRVLDVNTLAAAGHIESVNSFCKFFGLSPTQNEANEEIIVHATGHKPLTWTTRDERQALDMDSTLRGLHSNSS